jgi:hypothetical protein
MLGKQDILRSGTCCVYIYIYICGCVCVCVCVCVCARARCSVTKAKLWRSKYPQAATARCTVVEQLPGLRHRLRPLRLGRLSSSTEYLWPWRMSCHYRKRDTPWPTPLSLLTVQAYFFDWSWKLYLRTWCHIAHCPVHMNYLIMHTKDVCYSARLTAHPNDILLTLLEPPESKRLRRHLPSDLSTRFIVYLCNYNLVCKL